MICCDLERNRRGRELHVSKIGHAFPFAVASTVFMRFASFPSAPIIFESFGDHGCLVLYTLIFVSLTVLYFRGEMVKIPRLLWQAAFSGYSLSLMVLLFFRPKGQVYSYNLIPFSTILSYLSNEMNGLVSFYNLSANVGLFIPFGLYLLSREGENPSALRKFLYPLLSISGIEICQFVFRRGSLDVDDLILNMIGVYLGYILYPLFKRVVAIQG